MLVIVGLAVLVLDLALCAALIQGKAPSAIKGGVGWALSGLLTAGAVGLVALGLPALQQQPAESEDPQLADAVREDSATGTAAVMPTSSKKGGPGSDKKRGGSKKGGKRGGSKKGGKRGGSKKGGSKKGGKRGGSKKGGWSRRKRAPVVPLTPEREKQMIALRTIGAEFQARGNHVTRLQLVDTKTRKVTDKDLQLLGGLSETRAMTLFAPGATPAGLAPLAEMSGLTELDLAGTSVTDGGLVHLKGMKQLRTLSLRQTKIGNNGISVLAGMTQLAILDLSDNAQLGDKAVAQLAKLNSLSQLVLSGTGVTDTGVKSLVELTGLKQLQLQGTAVSDAAVEHLVTFKDAELLSLGDTKITEKGVARIRTGLPKCVISRAPR